MDNKEFDDNEALSHLDNLDLEYGINIGKEEEEVIVESSEVKIEEKPKSLGKARSHTDISEAGESPWKMINMQILPSKGMFYPEGSELLIRSAKTREIRHWSTMDESDPMSVLDRVNFILNSCTRFKIRGESYVFNFNDFCEIDRYHILFRIYELTFPNQENKLMANIECNKCSHVNRIQVTSKNLIGYSIPEDYLKYYSEDEKCFIVNSEKLGETLRFYIPTSGIKEKITDRYRFDRKNAKDVDESFYKIAPYILGDWRSADNRYLGNLKISMDEWSREKFNAINRFVTDMEISSKNKATGICESCKSRLENSIFLEGSFTVKDIFIISARFDELI